MDVITRVRLTVLITLLTPHLVLAGSSSRQDYTLTEGLATFTGGSAGTQLAQNGSTGGQVTAMADLNGDGADDLIIGSPLTNQTFVLLDDGSPWSSRSMSVPDMTLSISSTGSPRFGTTIVAWDLDLNGDDELLISAPLADIRGTDSGAVYVFDFNFTPDTATAIAKSVITYQEQNLRAGVSMVVVGDPVAPADPLILIGGPQKSDKRGAVLCVRYKSIPSSGQLTTDNLCWTGSAGDRLGTSLVVGDFDGDSLSDVAVGAPSASSPGEVWIVQSDNLEQKASLAASTSWAHISGPEASAQTGWSLATMPSSGGAAARLMVGSPGADGTAGLVQLFDPVAFGGGELAFDDAQLAVNGSTAGDELGKSVVWVGQLVADAGPGFVVGAPGYLNNSGLPVGGAFFFELSFADPFNMTPDQAQYGMLGNLAGDQAGQWVMSLPWSGRPGVLVTAPLGETLQEDEGLAGWFSRLMFEDSDGDGFLVSDGDCDDADSSIFPGAAETCNGLDDDCDDSIDVGVGPDWYLDNDGDGYGQAQSIAACTQPTGYAATNDDCDDNRPTVYPGAPETCDARDNNCDGDIDEGFDRDGDGEVSSASCGNIGTDCDDNDSSVGATRGEVCDGKDNNCSGAVDEPWDLDGDGVAGVLSCVPYGTDCNDADVKIYPGAADTCDGKDNNCDGKTDDQDDLDGDGQADPDRCDFGTDCDDTNSATYLGAVEVCDGLDNNCDGFEDEDFDDDGDGFTSQALCGVVGTDCDDTDASVNPDSTEVCDGLDNNCDGNLDEGFDFDGDGQPSPETCPDVTSAVDCDDTNASVYVGAPEQCNGVDDDCDGAVDEETSVDLDKDGFTSCGGDCNDQDASSYPGAVEKCDGKDNNCDDTIDDGFDQDSDGYLDVQSCPGASLKDCDDTNAAINNGATEVCDTLDNNCNGITDEGFDLDKDGHKDGQACGDLVEEPDCDDSDPEVYTGAIERCDGKDNNCNGGVDEGLVGCESDDLDSDGYTTDEGDCDDTAPGINPGQAESCNGIDDNCDEAIDEDFDADGDGYSVKGSQCPAPYGTDCDDTDANTYPGADELCDQKDNNCDGGKDSTETTDRDNDGVPQCEDCNDRNADITTPTDEICDGLDNDCDSEIDEDFDQDGDLELSQASCGALGADCNDGDDSINSRANEILGNGVDEDCDGQVADEDGDGYCTVASQSGDCSSQVDCDDTDDAINPEAAEIDNNDVDEDCDGQDGGTSEESPTAPPSPTPGDPSPGDYPAVGVGCGASGSADSVSFSCAQGSVVRWRSDALAFTLPILITLVGRLRRRRPGLSPR